jgi:hypothetical protein
MPAEQKSTCTRCLEWTTTVESVLEVLTNESCACEGCGQRGIMGVVADQYHKRRPRWWIVGSTVVVPMWIVEHLRMRRPAR